jgi:hypothetical protein
MMRKTTGIYLAELVGCFRAGHQSDNSDFLLPHAFSKERLIIQLYLRKKLIRIDKLRQLT